MQVDYRTRFSDVCPLERERGERWPLRPHPGRILVRMIYVKKCRLSRISSKVSFFSQWNEWRCFSKKIISFLKLSRSGAYSGRFRKPQGFEMWHTWREKFSNWTAPWYANELKFNFVLCWWGAPVEEANKFHSFRQVGVGEKEESNEITAVDDKLICNSWSKRRPNNWMDRHCRGRWRRHLICILSRCKHVNSEWEQSGCCSNLLVDFK